MTSFFIDLLCNESLENYSNNTWAYRGSQWEVALTNVSFPNRIYNVSDGEFTLGYIPTPTLHRYRVVVNKPDAVNKEIINKYPDVPILNQYHTFNIQRVVTQKLIKLLKQ